MGCECAQGQVLGPVPPVADLPVWEGCQRIAQDRATLPKDVSDGVERHASHEQHLARCPGRLRAHLCFPHDFRRRMGTSLKL